MALFQQVNARFNYLEKRQAGIVFTFFIAFLAMLLATRIAIVFCYQGHLGGIDNNFDYPVMRLLKSLSIYPDPENYPFAVNPYAPLFFYVSSGVCHLLGVEAGDTIQIYFVTRAVCLCCDLITMFMLYRVMRKQFSVDPSVAAIGALAFLYLISFWGYTLNRSDSMLMMWFSILVYFIIQYLNKRALWQIVVIALLCNLAIFTKQNALITPVLTGAVLLYHRQWKALMLFTVFFLMLFTGAILLFNNLYPNGNFAKHLIYALNNRIDFRWYYIYIFKSLTYSYVIIPFAAGLYLAVRRLFTPDKTTGALSVMILITAGWSLGLALKWGSHIGYFQECLFCITIMLTCTLCSTGFTNVLKKLMLPGLFVMLFCFTGILLQLYFYFLNDREKDKVLYTRQKEISNSLLNEVSGKDSYIFANTNAYYDFFKVMLQNKAVLPNIDAVACCTLPDGNFNYTRLEEGFNSGKIEFIIQPLNDRHDAFFNMKFSKYQPYATMHGYIILRYQP